MTDVRDVMTHDAGDGARRPRRYACGPRWPHCPRRSTTWCRRSGVTTCRSGRASASPSTGARVRGWVVEVDTATPVGVDPSAPQVVARVGTAARAGRARRVGGLALGRPGLLLPRGVVSRDGRAHVARRRPDDDVGPSDGAAARTARTARTARAHRRRPGPGRTGRHHGARATGHRPHRPRPVRRRRPGRPRPRRQHRRPGPVDRVGGAAPRPASCGGATRPRARGRRRGRDGRWWSGAGPGAWAPVPRLAAAVVLDAHDAAYREESAPTYSAVEVLLERARAGGRPVHARVTGAAGRAGGARRTAHAWRPRPARSGRAGRRSSGWTAVAQTRGRGMFSEEFVRLARSVLGDAARPRPAAPWCASTTARAAPACWPAGTAGSWPAVPAVAPRRHGRGTRRCCGARAAARRGRSSVWPAGGCA